MCILVCQDWDDIFGNRTEILKQYGFTSDRWAQPFSTFHIPM